MTSFSMTSLHVDLNEAIKCIDMTLILTDSFLMAHLRTCTKYKMATKFGITYENWSWRKMKVGDVTSWKKLTIGVQQVVRLLFDNHFINPGLVF